MHIYLLMCRKITAIQMQCLRRNDIMSKFKIPQNPPTVNKTIRFPSDVVEDVEKAIQGNNCTFSAFVIAAVRAALDNLE